MKNNKIHKLIDGIVHERMNKISADIILKAKNVKIDFSRRGLGSSGVIVDAVIKVIENHIKQGCKDTINEILSLKPKLNLKFKKKNYEHAIQVTTSRFTSFIQQSFDSNASGSVLRLPMIKDLSTTVDMRERILLQTIKDMVKKAFDTDKQMLKLKKDDPALKVAKRANILSWIALAVSAAVLVVAILTFLSE